MTEEQGKECGWEHFTELPAVRDEDDICDGCGGPTEDGFLEMESEDWLCAACFAKLPAPEE